MHFRCGSIGMERCKRPRTSASVSTTVTVLGERFKLVEAVIKAVNFV